MSARIVVTGFEAFGGGSVNPTAVAVRSLARDGGLVERVRFAVLPVTYDGAASVLAAIRYDEHDAGCLMFGLAATRPALALERTAYNEARATVADNAGVVRVGVTLVNGGDERLHTRAPIDALVSTLLAAGAPTVASVDPGRFVCNATYYRVLRQANERRPPLFVHVPPTRANGGDVEQDVLEEWIRAAIEAYLRLTDAPEPGA